VEVRTHSMQDKKRLLQRDMETLFKNYSNLRNNIFHTYRHKLTSRYPLQEQSAIDDLRAYIDEEFIRLVKEYDISSEVDFPYYIKRKLTARVSSVFMGKKEIEFNSQVNTKDDETVAYLAELGAEENLMQYYENTGSALIEYITRGVDLTKAEQLILAVWTNADERIPDKYIANLLRENFGLSYTDANKIIADMKEFTKRKIQEYSEQ